MNRKYNDIYGEPSEKHKIYGEPSQKYLEANRRKEKYLEEYKKPNIKTRLSWWLLDLPDGTIMYLSYLILFIVLFLIGLGLYPEY